MTVDVPGFRHYYRHAALGNLRDHFPVLLPHFFTAILATGPIMAGMAPAWQEFFF
jgi:hypothetical protein